MVDLVIRSAVRATLERWYDDPVALCCDVLPRDEWPREQQREILRSIWANPSTLAAAHRGWGKSRSAAFASIAFLATRANSLVMTLAPVWDQVVQGVWVDIRHLWHVSKLPAIFPTWRVLTSEIQTHPMTPKWRAVGAAASEVQNVEGKHPAKGRPALIIGDECKAINNEFRESVKGMLTHPESRFFGIGTPGIPYGWFYDGFTKLRSDNATFQFRGDQSPDPNVRAMVAKIQSEKGSDDPYFRQQWLAEFTGADDGVVIPLRYVQAAVGRKIEQQQDWRRVMALDVADGGADLNVLTYRSGPTVPKVEWWQGTDPMQTASRTAKAAVEFGASMVVVDEKGVGAGVRSRLSELLKPHGILVIGFNSSRSAKDDQQYENTKAEEVFLLRERFIRSASPDAVPEISIPDIPQLIGELCSWTSAFSAKGRTKIVDPPDSPDFADSCMMAFAADRLGQSIRGMSPSFL